MPKGRGFLLGSSDIAQPTSETDSQPSTDNYHSRVLVSIVDGATRRTLPLPHCKPAQSFRPGKAEIFIGLPAFPNVTFIVGLLCLLPLYPKSVNPESLKENFLRYRIDPFLEKISPASEYLSYFSARPTCESPILPELLLPYTLFPVFQA